MVCSDIYYPAINCVRNTADKNQLSNVQAFLLEDLSKNYNIVESGIVHHNGNKISLCSTDDYLSTTKEKFFLTYNKNTNRIHRTKLLLWLIKTGLINDTLYSLLIKSSKSEQSILNFASNQKFKELVGLWSYYDDFENSFETD